MILSKEVYYATDEEIIQLTPDHYQALTDLINLVQPGYFKIKTARLGRYYGIFRNQQLIAVTGERMQMNNYTEVSGVVVHPDHTRKGYASQLVVHTKRMILLEGKTPYLHVAETNVNAVNLYLKMGFETRRKISFWNIVTRN